VTIDAKVQEAKSLLPKTGDNFDVESSFQNPPTDIVPFHMRIQAD
jgi:hypothetical protein